MTKEEFIAVINENIEDDTKAVVFLEAFDDYVKTNDSETLKGEIARLESERDDVLRRYRERFSAGETVTEPDNADASVTIDEDEEEVIDVKELS